MKSAMSTTHFALGMVLALFLSCPPIVALAQEGPVKPFKDDRFSRQDVLQTADGGAYEVLDYNEQRDINQRDQEPERRVRSAYVDISVRRYQENETLVLGDRRVDVARVGPVSGEAFAVVFVHGRGGDRRLGVNDYSFGGNFNRLKNLVVRSGGTYYSVSAKTFDDNGAADVSALVRHAFERTAGRPVILACASMGGILCQHIARDKEAVRYLGGMVLLGGPPDPGLPTTPLVKLKVPIFFAHGSADSVYRATDQVDIYQRLRNGGYPARFSLFQTGGHGTPIRMVDWRKVLNFTLNAHR